MNAIDVKNVIKKYPDFLIDNISFSLPVGSIMGFIGENGAGKTTTIKLLLNMLERETGAINILGLDNLTSEKEIKQQLGTVFDQHFFCDDWTVSECEKAMAPFYDAWDSRKFANLINEFNLKSHAKVKSLSKGMQMKLMLATAFSHNAKLLLLDEPTSGLDPTARDELMEILHKYTLDKGGSVFFSTHIISDLEKIADYITFIHTGRIIYTGEKKGLENKFAQIFGLEANLSKFQKNKIIGFSKASNGFKGMIDKDNISYFDDTVFRVDLITIEEVMVFITKEDKQQND